MNDTFNFTRFGRYFASDLKNTFNNTWLTVLLTALGGIIAYAFCGMICLLTDGSWASYGLLGRSITFILLLYLLIIILPSKAYGFFTDKRSGGFYTLIPASPLEKFLAMFINTAILAPLAYFTISIFADGVLCLINPDCGESLFAAATSGAKELDKLCTFTDEKLDLQVFSSHELFWGVALNLLGWTMTFLRGALYFKKNKIGKTLLVVILFSMAMSIIITPAMVHLGEGLLDWLIDLDDPEKTLSLVKWPTYSLSVLLTLGLCVWAYLRVKTVKH